MRRSALQIFCLFLVFIDSFTIYAFAARHHHRHSGFSQAECPRACSYRCSETAYHKPCMLYCQKCCFKCKCVPPGTYGNKQLCPCYANWKTKRGGPKCP
ncbi:hypothetical protein AMTRI_Chr01g126640 [Amborella trichopoda]|uniref:gibberellin-regulated protein 5-like n=1 Tax=Amborella trichopoda TaxID=13333 RepID=UPI0005D3D86B|nr:gibberellin-regulated protein 5-like [Amborella trichopoda]|eukprot:XP_011629270.1 gibberellin-regulated protein 5-like [Amborella trichopoda]